MKKCRLLALALVLGLVFLEAQAAVVYVGSHKLTVEGKAPSASGEFYASVGPALQHIGLGFEHQKGQPTAKLVGPDSTIYTLKAGSASVTTSSGKTLKLASPCKLANGIFQLPLKATSQLLGLSYHGKDQIVAVAAKVLDCQIITGADFVELVLPLSAKTTSTKGALRDPLRVFLDIDGAVWTRPAEELEVDSPWVSRVRISQNAVFPDKVRLVADLKADASTSVITDPSGLTLRLRIGKSGALATPIPQVTEPPTPPSSALKSVEVNEKGEEVSFSLRFDAIGGYAVKLTSNPVTYTFTFYGAKLAPDFKAPAPELKQKSLERWRIYQAPAPASEVILELESSRLAGYDIVRDAKTGLLKVTFDFAQAKGPVVVLDAGHGGRDPGAVGTSGLEEEAVVLDVVLRARKGLEAKGYRVLLTRQEDVYVELYSRAYFANNAGASAFVSVHCNAVAHNQASGTEVYFNTPQSQAFANLMLKKLVAALGLPDRGVRNRRFVVCRCTAMPALLLELGYIDHDRDEKLLSDPAFRQKAADAIVAGVDEWLRGAGR